MWKVESSNPSWDKPKTYKMATCHYLALCSTLMGKAKDSLTQYQDNVTVSVWAIFAAVAKSVERRLPIQKIGSLNPSWVKPMTFKVDTSQYLAWCSALMRYDKDRLARYRSNVTVCDMRSWLLYVCMYVCMYVFMYGEFVSLYSCLMHTYGMAHVTELQQWRHHYYSLVVWWGMKLSFNVVGQADWLEEYRLVTVCTQSDFIVLPHWNNRPPALLPAIPPVTLSSPWANQSLPYPNNDECHTREWQVSILKSLVWINQGLKTTRSCLIRSRDLPEWEADAALIQPLWLVAMATDSLVSQWDSTTTTQSHAVTCRNPIWP